MRIQDFGAAAQSWTAIHPTSTKQASQAFESTNFSALSTQDSASVCATNFSNMSQNEMRGVAQHLYETGEIDLTQLGMLQMAGPIGKCGPHGEFIPFTPAERAQIGSTPKDYVKLVRGAIEGIESRSGTTDPKSGYTEWKHILSVLERKHGALPTVNVTA